MLSICVCFGIHMINTTIQELSGLMTAFHSRCVFLDLQALCLLPGSPTRQPSASTSQRSPTELFSFVSYALLSSLLKEFQFGKSFTRRLNVGKIRGAILCERPQWGPIHSAQKVHVIMNAGNQRAEELLYAMRAVSKLYHRLLQSLPPAPKVKQLR